MKITEYFKTMGDGVKFLYEILTGEQKRWFEKTLEDFEKISKNLAEIHASVKTLEMQVDEFDVMLKRTLRKEFKDYMQNKNYGNRCSRA